MISKPLFRIIAVCSFLVGAILGIIPLIPAFIGLAFFLVMFGIAPFILIYLKNLNILKTIEIGQSLVIGSVSGAVGMLGFAMVYFPIAFILQLIFKIQSFIWIKVLFVNIGFLIPMILLIALTGALLNAFSGFLTAYFYAYFQTKK